MRAIRRLDKFEVAASGMLDRIIGVFVAVGGGLILVWPFIFTGVLIAREFFNISTGYLEEYTGYWVLIITCLALAYTLRTGGHIRCDIILNLLSPRARNILEIFTAFIGLIATCIFTGYGIKLLIFSIELDFRSVYGTGTLLWPVYLWLPIGYGFLSLALLLYFFRYIVVVLGKEE